MKLLSKQDFHNCSLNVRAGSIIDGKRNVQLTLDKITSGDECSDDAMISYSLALGS